ncbi:MAG: osmoprotectant transporter permease [Proteobacteria bacterium]|nr:osmoprotectant transporter permease [Pseudomonadota bacterium]
MKTFRVFLAVDAIALLIAAYFFFVGIGDGSISSFNVTLWLFVLAGIIAILGVGYHFRTQGQTAMANGVLAILAVPTILAGLFVLSILIAQPRWN